MDLASKLQFLDLRSTFIAGATPLSHSFPAALRPLRCSSTTSIATASSLKTTAINPNLFKNPPRISSKLQAIATEASASTKTLEEEEEDIESLFSSSNSEASEVSYKRGNNKNSSGASSISSGVRLENVSKSYKGVTVLKDVNWEVKKGKKVGLVGVNGAGKTTQLRIIAGLEEPDSM